MKNDRVFTIYAVALIAMTGCMISTALWAGFAELPAAGFFLEHLALGLGVRTAYKSFGGFDWLYDLADAAGFYERTIPAAAAEATA